MCVAAHVAIWARRDAPSLVKMCSTCADTVFGEIVSAAAISRLVAPCPISAATSRSRAVSSG